MQPPLYSIIIPTYGSKGVDLTTNLLQQLKFTCRFHHEVIVVDDGSEDDDVQKLKFACQDSAAMLYHNKNNSGFAKTCNVGISNSNGLIVILCNNDVLPIGNTFDALADSMRFFGVGIMGCKLLYGNNTIQHAGVFHVPNPDNSKHGWFDHMYRNESRYHPGATTIDGRLCTGALLGIHTSLINCVGMLDERFGMACEDIDLNLRAIESSFSVVYNGYIEAYHLEGATRGNTPEEKEKHPKWTNAENEGMEKFFDKWNGISWTNFEITRS